MKEYYVIKMEDKSYMQVQYDDLERFDMYSTDELSSATFFKLEDIDLEFDIVKGQYQADWEYTNRTRTKPHKIVKITMIEEEI